MKRKARAAGFTLLELITVVAVIGLLAAILLPSMQRARYNAKVKQCEAEAKSLESAIRAYHHEYGQWPCPTPAVGGTWSSNNNLVIGYLISSHPDNTHRMNFWHSPDVATNAFGAAFTVAITTTNDTVTVTYPAP